MSTTPRFRRLGSQVIALFALSCSAELVVIAEGEEQAGTGGSSSGAAGGNAAFGGAGASSVGGSALGGDSGTGLGSGFGGAGAAGMAAGGSPGGSASAGAAFGGSGAGGSGTGGDTAWILCHGDSGCAGGSFCEFDSCTASSGRCRSLPSGCDAALAPSCGCSGVTYWNDCLRVSAGETQAASGACAGPNAEACGGVDEAPCADNGLCVVAAGCGSGMDGTCWDVPCPQLDAGVRYSSCDASLTCVDVCSARADLVRVYEDDSCF